MIVKCGWLDEPPSATKEFKDGGPNTETLLSENLEGMFSGLKTIFVIIRLVDSPHSCREFGSILENPNARGRILYTSECSN
jgi:hypothetical protein